MKGNKFPLVALIVLTCLVHLTNEAMAGGKLHFIYNREPVAKKGLIGKWGMVVLIEFDGKKVLFNTGAEPEVLKNNVEKLRLDLKGIDAVVLDHRHWEHWKALGYPMHQSPKAAVYCPEDLLGMVKKRFKKASEWNIRHVSKAEEITKNIIVFRMKPVPTFGGPSGVIGYHLALKTKDGLIVLIGCAHAGLDNIVQKAIEVTKEKPDLVLGGFRLVFPNELMVKDPDEPKPFYVPSRRGWWGKSYVDKLVVNMKDDISVKRIMPGLCSGAYCRSAFKKAYGKDFMEMKLGITLQIGDAKE